MHAVGIEHVPPLEAAHSTGTLQFVVWSGSRYEKLSAARLRRANECESTSHRRASGGENRVGNGSSGASVRWASVCFPPNPHSTLKHTPSQSRRFGPSLHPPFDSSAPRAHAHTARLQSSDACLRMSTLYWPCTRPDGEVVDKRTRLSPMPTRTRHTRSRYAALAARDVPPADSVSIAAAHNQTIASQTRARAALRSSRPNRHPIVQLMLPSCRRIYHSSTHLSSMRPHKGRRSSRSGRALRCTEGGSPTLQAAPPIPTRAPDEPIAAAGDAGCGRHSAERTSSEGLIAHTKRATSRPALASPTELHCTRHRSPLQWRPR